MNIKMIEDMFARRIRNSIGRMKAPRQELTFEQLKIYYQEAGLSLNDKFAANLELLTEEGAYNYSCLPSRRPERQFRPSGQICWKRPH